jgi:hypothetical protein
MFSLDQMPTRVEQICNRSLSAQESLSLLRRLKSPRCRTTHPPILSGSAGLFGNTLLDHQPVVSIGGNDQLLIESAGRRAAGNIP